MTPIVFDCDGVLADTERDGHLPAFNATFEEFGVPVHWSQEEYGRLLAIGGGKERLATVFAPVFVEAAGLPADPDDQRDLVARWHKAKTARYTATFRLGATTVDPWPRISPKWASPSEAASARPRRSSLTSRSLPSPATSRISKRGAPAPRKPATWQMGRRRVWRETLKGTTAGEWLCTTAITSGRAR